MPFPLDAPPRITVVTPTMNAVLTLPRALDSVRAQGYPNVEHIVIDGGSTDGTVELLHDRDDVSFVSEPDRGLSDALNKGLSKASGELIGWLNADDWYLPGAFDRVAAAAMREPAAPWVTGRCPIVDASGDMIRPAVYRYKNFFLRRYSFGLFLTQNFVACPATFVRSSAYAQVGPFDLACRYSMDYDMFLRVARLGDPVVIEDDLAVFTMAEGTLSMSGFEAQFEEHYRLARTHGRGYPVAVAFNGVTSAAIVVVYRGLRALRRLRRSSLGPRSVESNGHQDLRRKTP